MKVPLTLLSVVLVFTAILPARAQDDIVKKTVDKEWIVIEIPESARSGEEVVADITIPEGQLKEDSTLRVDFHTFTGTERHAGKGHAPAVEVPAGAEFKHTAAFTVPDDVTAVSFVLYTLPAGEKTYEKRTHAAEASLKVIP